VRDLPIGALVTANFMGDLAVVARVEHAGSIYYGNERDLDAMLESLQHLVPKLEPPARPRARWRWNPLRTVANWLAWLARGKPPARLGMLAECTCGSLATDCSSKCVARRLWIRAGVRR
jgi:hypothetical protein